jgi:hypothetical protein
LKIKNKQLFKGASKATFLILIFALCLNYSISFEKSFWSDELFSLALAKNSFLSKDFWLWIRSDVHPPIYYIFLSFYKTVFAKGFSEPYVRIINYIIFGFLIFFIKNDSNIVKSEELKFQFYLFLISSYFLWVNISIIRSYIFLMVFGYLAWYFFQVKRQNLIAKFLVHFVLSWLHVYGAIWSLSLNISQLLLKLKTNGYQDKKNLSADFIIFLPACFSLLFIFYFCEIQYYKDLTLVGRDPIKAITSIFNILSPNLYIFSLVFFVLPFILNLISKKFSILIDFFKQMLPLVLFALISCFIVYSGVGIFLTKYAAPTILPCMLVLLKYLNQSFAAIGVQVKNNPKNMLATLTLICFCMVISSNTLNAFKDSKFSDEDIKNAVAKSCISAKSRGLKNVYVLTQFSILDKYIYNGIYKMYNYYFEKNVECNFYIYDNLDEFMNLKSGILLVLHSSDSILRKIFAIPNLNGYFNFTNASVFIFDNR